MRTTLLLLASALPLAACDIVETGAYGQLEFVPDDCGTLGCNLGDRLAVGAVTAVEAQARGGGDLVGIELVSSDPGVFDVIDRDLFEDERVVIVGNAPGIADLLAVDASGAVVDYLPIEIAFADDVELSIVGDILGPVALGPTTDRYEALVGTELDLTARPVAGFGPLMGDTPFDVFIDEALAASLTDGDTLDRGQASLRVPPGSHVLTFVAPGGAVRSIELIGR